MQRQLTIERTREVWGQAKPLINDAFELERADNWSIREYECWKQHAYAGLKQRYVNTAARSDDFRDQDTPTGREHRRQVKKTSLEQSRQQFQAVTAELMKRTRRQGEFDRGVTVAVDFTKSPVKWHGDVERDADGNITEGWILDYKGGDLYYQIATIQIVGEDLPIILDFVPVKRGRSRADIVDDLLKTAKEMVNVREIQADREFDVTGVRRVIQDHGCIYRTAGKVTGLRGTCTKLRNMARSGMSSKKAASTG